MPIYEYECQQCRRRLEAMQRISDPPLAECPECGGPLKKLISAPAFQFKGSGWYVTDYARKSGGGEKASGDAGGKGDAGKGDAKGAAGKGDAGKGDKPSGATGSAGAASKE